MTHAIRDMETHLRNTWQWDSWGFTSEWDNCTLSDMDGFVPFFAERKGKFLVVEMKHWNGTGDCPKINYYSGQIRALMALSEQDNFTVVIGFGDTSTREVHEYKVFDKGGVTAGEYPFKDFLTNWYKTVNKVVYK